MNTFIAAFSRAWELETSNSRLTSPYVYPPLRDAIYNSRQALRAKLAIIGALISQPARGKSQYGGSHVRTAKVRRRARYRRIAWRLLPFLLICYVTAMVDRLNVGYAKLQFLADLHFDEATFGMAAGALYIGYILFEIPSNLLLERIGVRATLLRIMALWGVFAMAMAFAADRWSFYGLRFLLGVAEAGFFPALCST